MERSANSAIPITSQTAVSAGNLRRLMDAVPVAFSAEYIASGSIEAANLSTVSPAITSRAFAGGCGTKVRVLARERRPTAPITLRALDGERSVDARFIARA